MKELDLIGKKAITNSGMIGMVQDFNTISSKYWIEFNDPNILNNWFDLYQFQILEE